MSETKQIKRWLMPDGAVAKECRSCKAKIFWRKMESGKWMPIEAEGEHKGESHFAYCKQADSWRKPKNGVAISYTFGSKEGEITKWWQWSGCFWDYPQSVELYIFNKNLRLGIVLQWHSRFELDRIRWKWQPVWLHLGFGCLMESLTIDLWIPIWLLKRRL